jgi:hypothetical protein
LSHVPVVVLGPDEAKVMEADDEVRWKRLVAAAQGQLDDNEALE